MAMRFARGVDKKKGRRNYAIRHSVRRLADRFSAGSIAGRSFASLRMTSLAGKDMSGAAPGTVGWPIPVSAAPLWFILSPCRHSRASGKLPEKGENMVSGLGVGV